MGPRVYEATITDRYDDTATISTQHTGQVYLKVVDGEAVTYLSLSPKKARKFARALREAAKVAKSEWKN